MDQWVKFHLLINGIYWGFLKWWYPQVIHFNRVFHYKPSILGYHYFWKHPYIGVITHWSKPFTNLLRHPRRTVSLPTKFIHFPRCRHHHQVGPYRKTNCQPLTIVIVPYITQMTPIFEGQPPKTRPKLQSKQGSFGFFVYNQLVKFLFPYQAHCFVGLWVGSFPHPNSCMVSILPLSTRTPWRTQMNFTHPRHLVL